ncbi:MAG TPA: OmpA family protein [Planctomycetaceae bacterium]|jgi:NitT/TauT family transport system substrate-binding protein
MNGQPKPAFYAAVGLVVLALIAFAIWRADIFAPPPKPNPDVGKIDPQELPAHAEHPDSGPELMAKEYKFRPRQERLPEPAGVAAYTPLDKTDNTVRFALNVWAGWGPIILANNGFKPEHAWKTGDGKEFKVELVVIDDPVKMRDAYAAGQVHIGWGTLDMIPLFMGGFVDDTGKPRDARIMPRVFQQIDWSNGGDGIVVRESIKTVADLRGKKLVLAQNSPSHFFALNMLVSGGVQPAEVDFVFTEDAFQAAAAFNAQKDIAGCVSWAPDIYNLEKVKGNRMLVTTAQANKLITDTWFSRADFARDEPGIIEALVRGIFDAMLDLKQEAKKKQLAELMSKGYNIPAPDALSMQGDAHSTNWAENYQFFFNQNNPTNFERVWNQSYYLYRRIGSIGHQAVPFDRVMDPSVLEKLGKEEKYSSQKDEYKIQLTPKTVSEIKSAEKEILTNTIVVKFFPNSWDLHKKITRKVDGKDVEELYDPTVDLTLEEVAKLTGQFGAAQIIIEGHTDASMRGQAPASLVKELSLNRANSIKEALIRKYKELDPNRFAVEGMGWDKPADPADPDNHFKNRRVEIKVYSAEQQ